MILGFVLLVSGSFGVDETMDRFNPPVYVFYI